ncbi:MAG: peptidase [Fibrobacter sp.]|nr:peptidase [Fibrobacter sp.]
MFIILLAVLGLSAVARHYAFVPLRLTDSSMAPAFKERSVVWMCKLPHCLNHYEEGDFLWASLRGNENMVRKILALPGDTVTITDKGRVTTPRQKFKWNKEDSFIQSRSFYVPKAGDTLYFEKLNDVEQDYIIGYLREKGQHIIVQTTLWQGEHEIPLERVGATKIANRQVSLNEIDFLPWQDRFLIETQIRQSEPGNAPITLKRKIFRGKKQDVAADVKTADVISEPIHKIVMEDDCYYLICNKGDNCPDSRETGYVTPEKIYGRYMEWPTRVNNALISPVLRHIQSGIRIVSDTFGNVLESIAKFYESSENP